MESDGGPFYTFWSSGNHPCTFLALLLVRSILTTHEDAQWHLIAAVESTSSRARNWSPRSRGSLSRIAHSGIAAEALLLVIAGMWYTKD